MNLTTHELGIDVETQGVVLTSQEVGFSLEKSDEVILTSQEIGFSEPQPSHFFPVNNDTNSSDSSEATIKKYQNVECYMTKQCLDGQDVVLQHLSKFVDIQQISPIINKIKTDVYGGNTRVYKWVRDPNSMNGMNVVKITIHQGKLSKADEIRRFDSMYEWPKVDFLMSLGKDSADNYSIFIHGLTFQDVKLIKSHKKIMKHVNRIIMEKYNELYPIIMVKENKNFQYFEHYEVSIDTRKHFKELIKLNLIHAKEFPPPKVKWIKYNGDSEEMKGTTISSIQELLTDQIVAEVYAKVISNDVASINHENTQTEEIQMSAEGTI